MVGGFPGGSDGKESAYSARDLGLTSRSGRPPREGNGYPLFLPGELRGERSLAGYSPRGYKESDATEHTQYPLKNRILVNVERASALEGPCSSDRCDPSGHLF